jgi:hypothetical protein
VQLYDGRSCGVNETNQAEVVGEHPNSYLHAIGVGCTVGRTHPFQHKAKPCRNGLSRVLFFLGKVSVTDANSSAAAPGGNTNTNFASCTGPSQFLRDGKLSPNYRDTPTPFAAKSGNQALKPPSFLAATSGVNPYQVESNPCPLLK